MIRATIRPSTKLLDAQMFRRAVLTVGEKPRLGLEWQFGSKGAGLNLTDATTRRTLATTKTTIRGFPPRTHFTLEVTGQPPEIPTATIHYRWFNPRLSLGSEKFTPQMMRTGDDTFLTFDTDHWGFRVYDYETALHLHVAHENLLLPIAFTAYFVWTYHSAGRT